MSNTDEIFMSQALDCALMGRRMVEPNPMVGAIIVRDGVEISRGWHKKFGGPHAEIEAITAAESCDIHGATMYVTLEPCCHYGKTPPCTNAIIAAGIARVVVAMTDPNPIVAGKGLAILQAAGIEVTTGVLQDRAQKLLAPYSKLKSTGRPWIICKWAQTTDGYLAMKPEQGRWISCDDARNYMHEVRGWCDGILVGIGTVLADNPLLTNRGQREDHQPTRIVLDSSLRTPADCQLVQTAAFSPVCIVTSRMVEKSTVAYAEYLRYCGAEVLEIPQTECGINLAALLDEFGRRQWTYILVEGGANVLRAFVSEGFADELMVFVAQKTIGQDDPSLPKFDIADVLAGGKWSEEEKLSFGTDVMTRYRRQD